MEHQKRIGEGYQLVLIKRPRSGIMDSERVGSLREKLCQKTKQEKACRFYVLYDKLFVPYMLREGWKHVKANGGSVGIDGVGIADVESYWGRASLGDSHGKGRIVQTVCKLILDLTEKSLLKIAGI